MLGIWLLVRYVRRVQTGLLWFCFGGITLSIGFKISLFFAQPRYDFLTHQSLTHLRADSLLFGVLIACLHQFYYQNFTQFMSRYRYWILVVA